jgi:hypothetical protein
MSLVFETILVDDLGIISDHDPLISAIKYIIYNIIL